MEGLDDVDGMRAADPNTRVQVRAARVAHPEILDDFARENPFGLSERGLEDARRLRHAVPGRFYVERALKAHAIPIGTTQPKSTPSAASPSL